MCPLCQSNWVTFSKKRGTHHCHNCGFDATPDEYSRWLDGKLPLNSAELDQVKRAGRPDRLVVQRLLATLEASGTPPVEILESTHRLEYNPNCPSRYLVRLIRKGSGYLDGLPEDQTKDVLGYGQTYNEAATKALHQQSS